MKYRCSLIIVVGLLVASAASTVQAQINSPPPLLQGQRSKHLWSVAGIINDGMGTVIMCTNTSSENVIVGVEAFANTGGPALNDVSAQSRSLGPGETVSFMTRAMTGFLEDVRLAIPVVYKGSARVLATGSDVVCSALIADPLNSPPTSMANLTIVKKTKQRGD